MCKKNLFIGLAVAAVVGAWYITAESLAATNQPTPDFLAAAIEDQAAAAGISVEVAYTYAPEEAPEKIHRFRYVRTRDILYSEEERDDSVVARASFRRQVAEYRQLDVSKSGHSSGLISNQLQGVLNSLVVFDPVVRQVDEQSLAKAILRGNVSPEQESVGGSLCWRVEIPAANEPDVIRNVVAWLDPSVAFCPRRIELQHTAIYASEPTVVDFIGYEEVGPGVWFPAEIRIKTYVVDKGLKSFVMRRTSLRLGESYPPDELKVSFPSGTEVEDRILNANYTIP